MTVPNVLATRYAAPDLAEIWSPEHKIVLERQLWIAVLRAQRDLGVEVPDGVIEAYESVLRRGRPGRHRRRERVTRHDVKARIEEFCELAGHEHIHKGMTSRDLTENVEQLQVRQSLALLRDRAVAALVRLARLAAEHETTVMAGRSHNVAAQATTLGKRFATVADELLVALQRVEDLLARYPLRGIKGPMGTAQDMLDLLDGDPADAGRARAPGGRATSASTARSPASARSTRAASTSTCSPRSCSWSPAPSNLATTIRLMAGIELVTEGFQEGQVGSSAMPHKMNTRSCERVNGLAVVLRGYLSMVGELAGDQWNEGDVSLLGRPPGRAARRVLRRRRAVPDLPHRARRVRRLPGRDPARAGPVPAVPGHHQGADGGGAQRRRPRGRARGDQGAPRSAWRSRCAGDGPTTTSSTGSPPTRGSGLTRDQIDALVAEPITFTGAAVAQTQEVVRRVAEVAARHPAAAAYSPGAIL